MFIHVPVAWAVRPADVSRVSHKRGERHDPEAVRERAAELSRVLVSNHMNMINPLPALLQHDTETRMYNLYDIHFTVAGNKVVADVALPVIQQSLTPGVTTPP